MLLEHSMTLEDHLEIGLRHYMGAEKDNIASASTISIESVSGGHLMGQKMLRSQTIIKESR